MECWISQCGDLIGYPEKDYKHGSLRGKTLISMSSGREQLVLSIYHAKEDGETGQKLEGEVRSKGCWMGTYVTCFAYFG